MKFTPAASTFTSTSPEPGAGCGTSSRRSASGPPGVCTRIAFMPGNLSPPTTRVGEGEFHMKVGFIGLGSMGLPIARHVLQAGHTVVVYNRTRSRADALKPLRPTIADNPATAARGVDVLVTMVADDLALEDVMLGPQGALASLPRGAIHVSMSTISPGLSRRLAERHKGGWSNVRGCARVRAAGSGGGKAVVDRGRGTGGCAPTLPAGARRDGSGGDRRGRRSGARQRDQARGQLLACGRHRSDG